MMQRFHDDNVEQRLYIENVMSRHPLLKGKLDTSRKLSLMLEDAQKLSSEAKAVAICEWLRSRECHFIYLNLRWKFIYIL